MKKTNFIPYFIKAILAVSLFQLITTNIQGQFSSSVPADFEYAGSNALELEFLFTGEAFGIDQFHWDFGDGHDTLINDYQITSIIHTYEEQGSYDVCLTVTDIDNGKDTRCQTVVVEDAISLNNSYFSPWEVDFFVDKDVDTGYVYLNNYTPDSSGLTYFWKFGDGQTSNERKPVHYYQYKGYYDINLTINDTVHDRVYNKTKRVSINQPIAYADFKYYINADTVQFFNNSADTLKQFFWSFGDGTLGTGEKPTHVYKKPGIYKVIMVGWDGTNINPYVEYHVRKIRIGDVRCNSTFNYYADTTNRQVYFRSNTSGFATRHFWVFGDGAVSTKPNPVHQFKKPGFYKVKLTTVNLFNQCIDHHEEDVIVGAAGEDIKADFEYTIKAGSNGKGVRFINKSIGENLDYYWNVGTGNKADNKFAENPDHIYSTSDKHYTVCLTAYADTISHTKCKKITLNIDNANYNCNADFEYISRNDTVQCLNRSVGQNLSYEWDFDNGYTSDKENPRYTYADSGFYRVSLTIETPEGCKSKAYRLVKVGGANEGLKTEYAHEVGNEQSLKATGYPVDFVAVSHGDAAKLKWSFGDGDEDTTTTNPTHTYEVESTPDTFNACLEIYDPITGESDEYCEEVVLGAPSGVDELSSEAAGDQLNIYPNPVSNTLNIKYNLAKRGDVTIRLLKLTGETVETIEKNNKPAGEGAMIINLGDLKEGAYLVEFTSPSGSLTKPIIKKQ